LLQHSQESCGHGGEAHDLTKISSLQQIFYAKNRKRSKSYKRYHGVADNLLKLWRLNIWTSVLVMLHEQPSVCRFPGMDIALKFALNFIFVTENIQKIEPLASPVTRAISNKILPG